MTRRLPVLVTFALVLGLAACGSSSKSPARTTTPVAPSPSPSADAWSTLPGELARCGPQPAKVGAAGFTYQVLRNPEVGSVPAITAGRGRTVAVLLHQTDGGGLCGWLPFASEILARPGVAVVAVDLCYYGHAQCRVVKDDAFQTRAASLAVDLAVRRLHARRVVVVGASMGGSVALMTAVRDRRVDAAVDLSGPVDWRGIGLVRQGRALRVPVLVSMSDDELPLQVAGAKEIAANAPAGSRFLPAPHGHGYELLRDADGNPGRLAPQVLAWIRG
jgi:hypothetical protein